MTPAQSVAIIGMAGEFPSSPNLDRYWENILNNVDTARRPPDGRWLLDPESVYHPEIGRPDRVYSQKACFLDAEPDPAQLGKLAVDPDALRDLDPMFRLLLRVGLQTLADTSGEQADPARSGVIIGNLALPSEKASQLARHLLGRAFTERLSQRPLSVIDAAVQAPNQYVAGLPAALLAKAIGFQGTCFTVDAACASSLYAIQLAVDELLSGRADSMLAGGLSRPDSLYTQMGFSQLRALSPTGTCAPFDHDGNGLVVGEGCGLVLLKRTEDALRQGDRIYAVIRAIGVSNDIEGNLLAPASEGQLRAMRSAYKQAAWQPSDVDLIECHATGTPVGDAVEFNSLTALWKDLHWRSGQCVIGSVKANIGHLLTAAGAAALIKTLLALKHRVLPPTVNFSRPAPGIDLAGGPFTVLNKPRRWDKPRKHPRRAAVSAFGFGGINAHLLLEEWQPAAGRKAVTTHPSFRRKTEPVAIVGLACRFGPWEDSVRFQRRVMGGDEEIRPQSPESWWGLEQSRWFKQAGYEARHFQGYFIPEVSAVAGEFRIPPNELAEMLPRQLLMLKIAAAALADARAVQADHLFTGVYIGCGLDLNATNFTFRWGMEKFARIWAAELGLELDEKQLLEWVAELRNHAGPALTANRTMGALGSVVASRIAKNFHIGGPSFTLSSEENSGLRALEVAQHALQKGAINRALVGAVDLSGDLRQVLGRHHTAPYSATGHSRPFDPTTDGTLIGEGAAAVVLKRLSDAQQDGDKIYAVLRGLGTAIAGDPLGPHPQVQAYRQSLRRACSNAGTTAGRISYIEADGSGMPHYDELESRELGNFIGSESAPGDCYLGSCKADIGHSGCASGLASVVKVALCLQQKLLPPLRNTKELSADWIRHRRRCRVPQSAQYWLTDRIDGPRQALIAGIGGDGSCSHAILEEYCGRQDENRFAPLRLRPTGFLPEGLFVLSGDSVAGMTAEAEALRAYAEQHKEQRIDVLAHGRYLTRQSEAKGRYALSLVAESYEQLQALLDSAVEHLRRHADQPLGNGAAAGLNPQLRERLFYAPEPLLPNGKVAFVFPGSGNHFAGMGRELSALWPGVYRAQENDNQSLAGQYLPDKFWTGELADSVHRDHNALVIGHVACCTALHDLVRRFDIRSDMVAGYSLGEAAALFSTGAWRDRDGMLQRLRESTLFTRELAGECRAAQRVWGLENGTQVDWLLGMVDVPAERVRKVIAGRERVYLLIVNTYRETVIGGQRSAVEKLVNQLGCHFIPLRGVTTVHCEVTKAVAGAYRELHLFPVTPPEGIDFYSCALGRKYPVTTANAADAILQQALATIEYPQLIEQLYRDGARVFLELGPGGSCRRMINSILADRPHLCRSLSVPGQAESAQLLRLLAHCAAERVPLDLTALYPPLPEAAPVRTGIRIETKIGGKPFSPALPKIKSSKNSLIERKDKVSPELERKSEPVPAAHIQGEPANPELNLFQRQLKTQINAHQAYLRFSQGMREAMSQTIDQQMKLLNRLVARGDAPLPTAVEKWVRPQDNDRYPASLILHEPAQTPVKKPVAFDRSLCLEFATGSVAAMLGPDFAEVDSFPTRVRLPDEPLMLVDRIISVDGEVKSMTRGRVVTEHDVTADRWYLDGGRIPTCIAVEAGQADLFLSGYLGIDFVTRGKAVYRLLDAEVTFHRSLPVVGDVIRYDIKILEFFRQDQTYLFRFNFESSVDGEPLLTMRNGCAGFFTARELEAGQGIVHTKLDLRPQTGTRPPDWRDLAPLQVESYTEDQIAALYAGDLGRCFGAEFAALPLQRPYTLPGGKLKLVDRVTQLDPQGGRYGLGQISAEMDIRPQDWFLTCHFVDDRVMPGTLMYECCLHTLRIYLLRLGWIGEEGETWCEPIPGVTSGLKCRGQVTEKTRTVTYRVSIKELGYRPEPFAVVDALMYADGHPIVEIPDMSIRLSGLNREKVEGLWRGQYRPPDRIQPRQILYDTDKITAFAIGNPSAAFGEPYRVFDDKRRIARLPGPPYQFLDRIVAVDGEPFKLTEGVTVTSEYDVPPDAWYFTAGGQQTMPFAVLLEIGLQPCGWLAAYMGSALTSETDLSFRNLDGNAVQTRQVTASSGTLTTRVKITRIAGSAGMIIQSYDFSVSDAVGPVYSGDTVFGFFSASSLAQQVGIHGAQAYQGQAEEQGGGFPFPQQPPYPQPMLRMLDGIETCDLKGGPQQLGYIRGNKRVDPDEWFFKAHFYQDPVCPGSLGLESFLQLLKIFAAEKWTVHEATQFEAVALDQRHTWQYRGQIIPANKKIIVEAVINAVDETHRLLKADGYLSVDGIIIYQMKDFTLRMVN